MLMPGELHFGGDAQAIKTLLGSCVALTLWHAKRRIGGMCHFLLPSRPRPTGAQADGRFGEEAVAELVTQLERHGCRSNEFTAHLYGGADTLADDVGVKLNVGERNIERGWALVDQYGFTLDGVDVGDNVPRTVTLELATGSVACRRGNPH
ncbi:MAG: chemotaxis protein CheD [Rubrivivax sp.]|nr:chemotaxis protein CheD [Rubrivivax sp.]